MKVINFKRQDHCIKCHTDRVLELYDMRNNPINYSYFLDNIKTINPDIFNKINISSMRCKKCGAIYDITWENKIPEPLTDRNALFVFLNSTFKRK